MLNLIIKLIMVIVILIGMILIFDARILARKYHRNQYQSKIIFIYKIIGFIISIIAALIIYCIGK